MFSGLMSSLAQFFGSFVPVVCVAPWEQGLRVRAGKHVRPLPPGFHWRLPIIDAVHKQTTRLRTAMISTQTLTTADGSTIVVGAMIGYAIADLEKIYRTLHDASDTITGLAALAVADFVLATNRDALMPAALGAAITEKLTARFAEFGLESVSVRVTDFAYIRAFRLIQDGRWTTSSDLNLERKL